MNGPQNTDKIIPIDTYRAENADTDFDNNSLPETFDFNVIEDSSLRDLATNLADNNLDASVLTQNPYVKDLTNLLSAYVRGDDETMVSKSDLTAMINNLTNLSEKDKALIEQYRSLLEMQEVQLLRSYERAVVDQTRFDAGSIEISDLNTSLDSYRTEAKAFENKDVINSINEVIAKLDDPELASALAEILKDSNVDSHILNLINSILSYLANPTLEESSAAKAALIGLNASLIGKNNENLRNLIGVLGERVNDDELERNLVLSPAA